MVLKDGYKSKSVEEEGCSDARIRRLFTLFRGHQAPGSTLVGKYDFGERKMDSVGK